MALENEYKIAFNIELLYKQKKQEIYTLEKRQELEKEYIRFLNLKKQLLKDLSNIQEAISKL